MKTLIIRDVWDFGVLNYPYTPTRGIDVAQALIHELIMGVRYWGVPQLASPVDQEVFVANVLETIEGFQALTERQQVRLLYEGIHYLHAVHDYVESLGCPGTYTVTAHPPDKTHRRVALLV